MNLLEILLFLLVAAICGSIARAIAGGTSGGCLVSIAVGFIGALLGGKLSQLLDLPELFVVNLGGAQLPVLWSIVGGALFVAVVTLLTGGRRRA